MNTTPTDARCPESPQTSPPGMLRCGLKAGHEGLHDSGIVRWATPRPGTVVEIQPRPIGEWEAVPS